MSLRVDEGRRRTRSKSPGRPVEERAERPAYDTRESSYAYPEDDLDEYPRRRPERRDRDGDRDRDDDYRPGGVRESSGGLPYPAAGQGIPYPEHPAALVVPGAFDDDGGDDDHHPKPVYRTVSPPSDPPYRSSRENADDRRSSRVRYSDHRDEGPRHPDAPAPIDADERFKFLPQKYSKAIENADKSRDGGRDDDPRRRQVDDDGDRRRRRGDDNDDPPRRRRDDYDDGDDNDGRRRRRDEVEDDRWPRRDDNGRPSAHHPAFPPSRRSKKEALEENLAYGVLPRIDSPPRRSLKNMLGFNKAEEALLDKFGFPGGRDDRPEYPPPDRKSYRPASYEEDHRRASSNVLTVDPENRVRDSSRHRRGDPRLDNTLGPPTGGMSMLSVDPGGYRAPNMSVANAPPSPLLESYHGTYQQSSPMPSPMLLAQAGDLGNVVEVSPLDSDDGAGSGDDRQISRRARFHHPEEIAVRLANALKGDRRAPDTEPLIQILPGLGHEEVMELRTQYKAIVKAGSSRKGVNVAKHIRSRLRDDDPNLMKACYAVALGQWESEAYWANFWYQGDKTRRELLIESLMGRTNSEVRNIKEGFQDKKYGNSLAKCMQMELKEDKFKKAVLLVLAEERMEEVDEYGRPLEVDMRLVGRDAADLRRSVESERGGESLMISIVVLRSDAHLREIMKEYSHRFGSNFARDALKKSTNLVGELLAHVLNGVINKPVRDALLLHHALTASRKDDLRRELLTSRLVRYHWDRRHMEAVKRAYAQRYGRDLGEVVKEVTSGEWGLFCGELCIRRMPNDVRRVARLDVATEERGKSRERERRPRGDTLEVGERERGKSRSRERRPRGDTLEVGGRERGKSRSRSRGRD